MVGPCTCARTDAAMASGERPRLLNGVNTSASAPVIWRTASTSPSAMDPCASTIPRTADSLIILLQVLLERPHVLHEALVEQLGRIGTRILEQMVHGHDFGQHGQVFPCVQRDDYFRKLHPQNFHFLDVQPGAVVRGGGSPLLQLNHDLDALLLTDGADAEKRAHVDDADATNLHVVALQL